MQAIDPRDTLRFGAPNATLIDVRLEVVFPHPDEPPFATAIQDLLVLAQCAPADFNECGRFAGPSEFRGPSPLSVLLEGLKIPPPGELVLEFRIPDASPSDEVIFEFDPRVAAHVTGEVRFLAVDEPS